MKKLKSLQMSLLKDILTKDQMKKVVGGCDSYGNGCSGGGGGGSGYGPPTGGGSGNGGVPCPNGGGYLYCYAGSCWALC